MESEFDVVAFAVDVMIIARTFEVRMITSSSSVIGDHCYCCDYLGLGV